MKAGNRDLPVVGFFLAGHSLWRYNLDGTTILTGNLRMMENSLRCCFLFCFPTFKNPLVVGETCSN